MDRRTFLRNSAIVAASALLPDLAHANAADPWSQGYATAAKRNPYLLGFKSVAPDALFDAEVSFEGRLPDGLQGVLYRNGPALHEMAGLRYHHWFDGDGLVHAFRIGGGKLVHKARLVLTDKLKTEIASGKRRRDAFGTAISGADPTTSPDVMNVANTSILPHAGEVLALWEGGSAYGVDPRTLDTLGPKVWREDLKGLPFSAHPKVDATGRLWNFGLSTRDSALALYAIDAAGAVKDAKLLNVPDMTMVHDFVVTDKHLVFLLPPIRYSAEKLAAGASFNESHAWVEGAPMRALTVEKADLQTHRLYDLPSGFVFHFGNAWEDAAGVIRFDYVRCDDATNLFREFREVMRGEVGARPDTLTTHVTLDPASGRATQVSTPGGVEFPRIDPRYVGERNRYLFSAAQLSPRGQCPLGFDGVRRLDVETGRIEVFGYGDFVMAEEHLFVPDPHASAEGEGWLLGTSLDVRAGVTRLSVFDAAHLSDGPVATARLPYALPLGLHGNFRSA
jgi:carotenoid cleavage dioxygenase